MAGQNKGKPVVKINKKAQQAFHKNKLRGTQLAETNTPYLMDAAGKCLP